MSNSLNRPRYHFMPPANWMNDPNGLIQWNGQYHLFYQYNPDGAFHGNIHWGHAISPDLVHWTHLPIALAPTPNGPDQGGCWSGVIVNQDGTPVAIYTGVHPQRACLAFGSPDLIQWEKYDRNPIISAPAHLDLTGFRDHSLWRESDLWYQVIGSGALETGGMALLYRSSNLLEWEYLHPLCSSQDVPGKGPWSVDMWECPDFFPLGDQHVLVVSGLDERSGQNTGVFSLVGLYRDGRFQPQRAHALDAGGSLFYAPQSFSDDQGRRIQFGWIREDSPVDEQVAQGWSGVMSLPRQLSLRSDGRMSVRPVSEVRDLRRKPHELTNLVLTPSSPDPLAGAQQVNLELELTLAPDSGPLTLGLRCTPDGIEQTLLHLDPAQNHLRVDRSHSSLNPRVGRAEVGGSFELDLRQSPICLRVFLDGSLLEVFVNDDFFLTTRIYPICADSTGLQLKADGPVARIAQLRIWEMHPVTEAQSESSG